jgi:hypothetical protein
MWWLCLLIIPIWLIVWRAIQHKKQGPMDTGPQNQLPAHVGFSKSNLELAYLYLATWLIRKNAQETAVKITFIQTYFKQHFNQNAMEVSAEIGKALKYSTNIRSVAHWVTNKLVTAEERVQLIEFLIDLGSSGSPIIDREIVAIMRFGNLIGISNLFIQQAIEKRQIGAVDGENVLPSQWLRNSPHHFQLAIRLLQIEDEKITLQQLKRAFRKLANRYHPDKLKIDDNDAKSLEQFRQIKEAYDYLRLEIKQ